MPLESERPAPSVPQCVEPGCDRAATDGDERCALHQQRLGARPSRPSAPTSLPPRPAPSASLPVVETALDASVAKPPPKKPRARDLWFAMGGWAIGNAGLWGGIVLGEHMSVRGVLGTLFAVLLLSSGVLATYGAAWFAWKSPSKVLGAIAGVLALLTGLPVGLGLVLVLGNLLASL